MLSVKELCSQIGIGWDDEKDVSEIIFVSLDKYKDKCLLPMRVNNSGVLVSEDCIYKYKATILDLITQKYIFEVGSEPIPIKCKVGEFYKAVVFENKNEKPEVQRLEFVGDIIDYYNMHTGNMFKPTALLSQEFVNKIMNGIIDGNL